MQPKHCIINSIYALLAFSTAACKQPAEQPTNATPGEAYSVSQPEDDAEEGVNGQVVFANDDLDLGQTAGFESAAMIGLRFQNIRIAQGSQIKGAFLQFTADDRGAKDEPTDLAIRAELVGDANSFNNELKNISSRELTHATVNWSPDTWYKGDGRGPRQRSPDLSAVIQEVVDQDDWAEGNALVIVITGKGERDAISFDGGGNENGPTLFIETR
jgi:hypothetical protein